ncbi:MAG: hypothetical protein U1F10_10330 [Burkholderiales bacterium]
MPINREPAAFRGALFDEVAVVTRLAVVAGLLRANGPEHAALPVYATAALGFALAAVLLQSVTRTRPRVAGRSGGDVAVGHRELGNGQRWPRGRGCGAVAHSNRERNSR